MSRRRGRFLTRCDKTPDRDISIMHIRARRILLQNYDSSLEELLGKREEQSIHEKACKSYMFFCIFVCSVCFKLPHSMLLVSILKVLLARRIFQGIHYIPPCSVEFPCKAVSFIRI